MAAILIDARVQFGLARMKASAQRGEREGVTDFDIEYLDAELRAAMSTGEGFETPALVEGDCTLGYRATHDDDDDGRLIGVTPPSMLIE